DSDELVRRMNLEAAKVLKYSRRNDDGTPIWSESDALAFVTINPAIQMGVDDRVGSLEPGKDADLVVWTGSPLSSYSNVDHVFIDGRHYFSRERDAEHRESIRAERERLIQKILAKGAPATKDTEGDDAGDDSDGTADPGHRRTRLLASLYGINEYEFADTARPGECGCGVLIHSLSEREYQD
ncbi:MAG: amidohydrolase family protein, partial [Planctomycetota bacterium]